MFGNAERAEAEFCQLLRAARAGFWAGPVPGPQPEEAIVTVPVRVARRRYR